MKSIIKFIMWVVIVAILLFGSFLLYITIADFRPKQIEVLFSDDKPVKIEKDTFSLISWNIGYGGLGAEMDFFYDGGKKVRPTPEHSKKYLAGIEQFIVETEPVDFWLLQEVDVHSKRSYAVDQVKNIGAKMKNYHQEFAKNYDVAFVPVPLREPMGYVKGGLLNLSAYAPSITERYAYPLIASWPDRLFLLDRCFTLSRFPLINGKDLVVMNTHNSAYVYDSVLRLKELKIIKDKMLEEYAMGNYVVAGGDWNANPPGLEVKGYFNGHRFEPSTVKMAADIFDDGWSWVYDPSAPSNRNNDKAFIKGENGTTILDYFVVSPNVEIIDCKTIDLEFENSDHNPVRIEVALK